MKQSIVTIRRLMVALGSPKGGAQLRVMLKNGFSYQSRDVHIDQTLVFAGDAQNETLIHLHDVEEVAAVTIALASPPPAIADTVRQLKSQITKESSQ